MTKLAKLSCEAGAEALKLGLTQESMQPAKKVLEDAMSRRFELLASACYKETDRKVRPTNPPRSAGLIYSDR